MPGESKIEQIEIVGVEDTLTCPKGWDAQKFKPYYSVIAKGQEKKIKIKRDGDAASVAVADKLAEFIKQNKGKTITVVIERGVYEGKPWAAIRDAIKDGKPISALDHSPVESVQPKPQPSVGPKTSAPAQRPIGPTLGMLINNSVLLALKTSGEGQDRKMLIQEGAFWFKFLCEVEAKGVWESPAEDDIPF